MTRLSCLRFTAHKPARYVTRFLLALMLVFLSVFTSVSGPVGADSPNDLPPALESGQRVIVRLAQPALAHVLESKDGTLQLGQPQARAYQAELEQEQRAILGQIQAALPGVVVERTYQLVFNGFALSTPESMDPASLQELESLPGVERVYPEVAYQPTLFSSLPLIQAETLWQSVGGQGQAGSGVKIAIIDSGIDIHHPMFDSSTFAYPAGYPRGDGRYTTPKVIVSRAYFRPNDAPAPGESTPLPGPKAGSHGTHIAGIAAGRPVSARYGEVSAPISGVAPRAWLMNYRVFYPTAAGTAEVAYSPEILQAIEDAVGDGADVICNGWSAISTRSVFDSPIAEALENAMNAGSVVVAGAGNEGPGFGSASQLPGSIERVITVGAVSKEQVIASDLLDVTGPQPVPAYLQSVPFAHALFGPAINAAIGPYPYVDVRDVSTNRSSLACEPLPVGSLAGKIALIGRGECDFAAKVYHAQQAGAVMALIYNTEDELVEIACGGEYCDPGDITIPVAVITRTAGERLSAWAKLYPNATLKIDPNPRIVNVPERVIQSYSGRGPAYMRSLKPDVVAPGANILSAAHDPAQGAAAYAQLSGTSMACAHVAGAAALLLQSHPTWTHDQVKAALMNTADLAVYANDTQTTRADVLARGAGLVDLSRADSPSLLLSPASLSVPSAMPGRSYTLSLTIRGLFTSGPARSYSTWIEGGQGLIIEAPSSIQVAANGTSTMQVTIRVPAGAQAGDLQADIHLLQGSTDVHLPLWVHVDPLNTSADVLLIDNDFSNFESYRDYAPYVTKALDALGYSYAVWDADKRFGNPQTIPNVEQLQQYDAIIWLTGDNVHPDGYFVVSTPLTPVDLSILGSYLDGGGRLIAIGQNLAEASDVNENDDPTWGRANFYHAYLGAHWLQGNVFRGGANNNWPPSGEAAIVGLPGAFLADMQFDIGRTGDGADNQNSVDEIAPGGLPDGSDADLVQPLLVAIHANPQEAGYVAVAKADEPTLEDGTASLPYRTLYYSFGLEGVNGSASRQALLGRSLSWLKDRVQVKLSDAIGPVH
ncbi:MAG: S8 family serine peptidase, partial [Chloroflexi bacterium]|nr:S8 family serine peptidase [Chloroflexota bacterium]